MDSWDSCMICSSGSSRNPFRDPCRSSLSDFFKNSSGYCCIYFLRNASWIFSNDISKNLITDSWKSSLVSSVLVYLIVYPNISEKTSKSPRKFILGLLQEFFPSSTCNIIHVAFCAFFTSSFIWGSCAIWHNGAEFIWNFFFTISYFWLIC